MHTAIDYSPTSLRGSFDTSAISSLADIICMHQKILRFQEDIDDVFIDKNLIEI